MKYGILLTFALTLGATDSFAQHPAPMGHPPAFGHGTQRMGNGNTNRGYGYPRYYGTYRNYGNDGTNRQVGTYPGSFRQNNFQQFQGQQKFPAAGNNFQGNGQTQFQSNSNVYSNLNASPTIAARSENLRVLDELGIRVQTYTKNAISRLVITDVAIGGLAHRNGIRPGDMIIRANTCTIITANDLAKAALRNNKSIYLVIQSQTGRMRNVRIDAIIDTPSSSGPSNPATASPSGSGTNPKPYTAPQRQFKPKTSRSFQRK